jgi:TolB protein
MKYVSAVLVLFIFVASALAQQRATPTPTPTPMINGAYPIVSPSGKQIVFLSNRTSVDDLFVIRADGTGEMQVTHTPEYESATGWTSKEKQIVFFVTAKDVSHVYTVGLDGNNQREIGSVPGRGPALSPDRKRFVYMAGTWTATRLMVSGLDGSDAKLINDGSSIAWNNHWSPDGKWLAFTGSSESGKGLAVFVMKADGSERRQVTHLEADDGNAQWPVWSQDGRQLAIQVSNLKLHSGNIWVVDVASGEAHKLAAHDRPYLDETPYWFPNGKRIAFQSNRTGRMEVWVMNVDGSGQRQVTGMKEQRR